jgi:hypothetical protein
VPAADSADREESGESDEEADALKVSEERLEELLGAGVSIVEVEEDAEYDAT